MPEVSPGSVPPVATPGRRRRRPRLSLRALMILVLIVGAPLGWVARRAAIQRRAVAAVRAAGGGLTYSDQYDAAGQPLNRLHEPWAPAWLRRVVGDEPFEEVVGVFFDARRGPIRLDEATLAAVASFSGLQTFFVNGSRPIPGVPVARPLDAANLTRLAGLTRLRDFRLFDLEVDPAVMDLLPSWPSLEEVTVVSPAPCLPGSSLRPLGRLPRLRTAVISALESSTPADLAPLLALPNLSTLIVGRAPRSDAGLLRFAQRRPGLAVLDLLGTEITEPTLIALAEIPGLQSLGFDATRLPPGALRQLGRASRLRSLSVMLDGQAGPPGWPRSNHRAAPRFGDADLDALRGLPLDAFGIMGLDATDAGVARFLARHKPTMLTLGGRGITDASVAALLAQPTFYYLTLTDTGLTDDGLVRLAGHPDLRDLALLDNANLTDRGVAALAGCARLEALTVRQPGVTTAALDALRRARPRSGGIKVERVADEAR